MTARASKRVGIAGWLGALTLCATVGITGCGDDSDCKEARTCASDTGEGGESASEGGNRAASPDAGGVPGSGAGSQTDAGDSGVGGREPVECTSADDCDDGQSGNGIERCGSDGLCEFGNPPPTVVAVYPDANATEIEPDTEVVITFSESIEAATVTVDNFNLLDDGVPIAGTLTHEGEKVTFKPAAPLALFAEFEVAVQTGVTDEGGISLLEAHSSTFRIRDGVWHTSNAVVGTIYQLAETLPITRSGDALVAWISINQPGYYCPTSANWFNRGEPVNGEPAVFTELDIQDCRSVAAGANADGVGVVVWQEDVEYAQQYRSGQWGSPKQIVSGYTSSYLYTAAVAPDGTVSFFQQVGETTVAWRTNAHGTWSTFADPVSSSTGLTPVSVAFDAESNGVAAWVGYDRLRGREAIFLSNFTTNGFWVPAKQLSKSLALGDGVDYERGAPAIAVDGEGRALVLWTQRDGLSTRTLMASRQIDETQWTTPQPISGTLLVSGRNDAPALVFDGETFVAAWTEQNTGATGGKGGVVKVARFDMDLEQFSAPEERDAETASLSRMPRLVSDAHHHLLLVWARTPVSSPQLVYSRYDALEATWSEPTEISGGVVRDTIFATGSPMPVSMNASGLGALMWGDKDPTTGRISVIRLASFH